MSNKSLIMSHTMRHTVVLVVMLFISSGLHADSGDDMDVDECPDKPCQQTEMEFSCIGAGCFALPDEKVDPYVKKIYLSNNNISRVTSVDLDYEYLEILDLNTNIITELIQQPFKNLYYLQELDLGNNSIYDIKNDAFAGLNKLVTLILKSNDISVIPIFKLDKLQTLDLSSNLLTTLQNDDLEYRPFEEAPNLKLLDLSYNMLWDMENHDFKGLEKLEKLFLNGNNITKIGSNVFYTHLKSLLTLDLRSNIISSIDHNAFSDVENLEYLHLEENAITTLDVNHFLGLLQLQYLYLGHNNIQNITNKTFYECINLQMLHLGYNKIQNIDDRAFFGLVNVKAIVLTGNEITTIRKNLFQDVALSLEELYLDNNPITMIEPLSTLVFLKIVSFDGTKLTTIKNATFTGLWFLEHVTITNNVGLREIEAGAFDKGNSSAKYVDFSNNKLRTLSNVTLNWARMQQLTLADNPWDCDCHIYWIKASENISADTKSEMKCASPYQVQGKTLDEVDDSYFNCGYFHDMRHQVGTGLVCVVTMVFILLCILLVHRMRHQVLPCCYPPGAQYKYMSMYNPVHTDDVNINWGDSEEKGGDEREKLKPPPVAV